MAFIEHEQKSAPAGFQTSVKVASMLKALHSSKSIPSNYSPLQQTEQAELIKRALTHTAVKTQQPYSQSWLKIYCLEILTFAYMLFTKRSQLQQIYL